MIIGPEYQYEPSGPLTRSHELLLPALTPLPVAFERFELLQLLSLGFLLIAETHSGKLGHGLTPALEGGRGLFRALYRRGAAWARCWGRCRGGHLPGGVYEVKECRN